MDFTAAPGALRRAESLPWAAVWDAYCEQMGAPVGIAWLDEVRRYEQVVGKRI